MKVRTKVILVLSIILTVVVLILCIIGYAFFKDMFAKIFGIVLGGSGLLAVTIAHINKDIKQSKEDRRKRHEEINDFNHSTFDPSDDPFHNRDQGK